MTWLVIASECDTAALWAGERLSGAGGLDPLHIVSDTDLVGAVWDHRLGSDGASTRVSLSDGRIIDGADVVGTLNRLTHVAPPLVASVSVEDRTYALQELSALVMSWLASLPGVTLNPPDTRGLSGAWRSPGEWALLANAAGLRAAPAHADSRLDGPPDGGPWHAWPPYAPYVEDVIVVGDAVFARDTLDHGTITSCRRLASIANTPLLGLKFTDGDPPAVVGVTPLPDLRRGGDELLVALVDELRSNGSRR